MHFQYTNRLPCAGRQAKHAFITGDFNALEVGKNHIGEQPVLGITRPKKNVAESRGSEEKHFLLMQPLHFQTFPRPSSPNKNFLTFFHNTCTLNHAIYHSPSFICHFQESTADCTRFAKPGRGASTIPQYCNCNLGCAAKYTITAPAHQGDNTRVFNKRLLVTMITSTPFHRFTQKKMQKQKTPGANGQVTAPTMGQVSSKGFNSKHRRPKKSKRFTPKERLEPA